MSTERLPLDTKAELAAQLRDPHASWYAGTPAQLLEAGVLTPELIERAGEIPSNKECSVTDEFGSRVYLRAMVGGRLRVVYTVSSNNRPSAKRVAEATADTVDQLLARFARSC